MTDSLTLNGNKAASPLGYLSWAACQGARDPYYILVVIYIFYPYFSNVVVGDPVRGQSLLGYTTAVAGLVLALTAPILGAVADKNGRRKPWIAGSVMLMVIGAVSLWFSKPAGGGLGIYPTLTLLILISIAFTISEVFHNAMLASTAPANRIGLVSGLAFSFGNVGGLSLMLLVLYAFSLPGDSAWSFIPSEPWFGLDRTTHEHDRIVGPLAAVWMLVFTLPLLLFTPDAPATRGSFTRALASGLAELRETIRELGAYRNVALYLVSRMFFFDGMAGVLTFGGVYASGTFGWDTTSLLLYGLCTSFSAMIGAYLGGLVDDRIGSKRALQIAIAMSATLLCVLVSIRPDQLFFFIAYESGRVVWDFPYFRTLPEIAYFITNQIFAVFSSPAYRPHAL